MISLLSRFVSRILINIKPESMSRNLYSTLIGENVVIFQDNNNCIVEKELLEVVNKDFSLIKNYLTIEQESNFINEIEKSFRRTKYEYDHWDGVSFYILGLLNSVVAI